MESEMEKATPEFEGVSYWATVIPLCILGLIYLVMFVGGLGVSVFSNKITDPPALQVPASAVSIESAIPVSSDAEVLTSVTIDELDATAPRIVWSLGAALLHLGYAGFAFLAVVAIRRVKSSPIFGEEMGELGAVAAMWCVVPVLGILVRQLSRGWVANAYGLAEATVPESSGTGPFELFPFFSFILLSGAVSFVWRQGRQLQTFNDEAI